MEEFYKAIEETLRAAGCPIPVSGAEIYDEICDEIEDREPGAYVFMLKKTDDVHFEYRIQIYDDEFNLSSIDVVTKAGTYHADFD